MRAELKSILMVAITSFIKDRADNIEVSATATLGTKYAGVSLAKRYITGVTRIVSGMLAISFLQRLPWPPRWN